MKVTIVTLLTILGIAQAGKRPQLSLSVRDGYFNGIDGLDPTVAWEGSSHAGELDISYGVSAQAHPTSDIASLPKSVWGKVSTDISGWGVSARAQTKTLNLDDINVELSADNEDLDLSLRVVASAGVDGANVRSMEATKGIDTSSARYTVTPRFNLESDTRDVVVKYDNDRTNVRLTASIENQEISISRQIDEDNRVAPTVNSHGDVSLEWEHYISDDSSVTAILKPNDNLNVEWRDHAWTANIRMPIDGTHINGADVSVKRDIVF